MEVGLAEVGLAEVGLAEVGPAEVGPAEGGPVEVGPAEVGPAEVGPVEVGPVEIGPLTTLLISQPFFMLVQDHVQLFLCHTFLLYISQFINLKRCEHSIGKSCALCFFGIAISYPQ